MVKLLARFTFLSGGTVKVTGMNRAEGPAAALVAEVRAQHALYDARARAWRDNFTARGGQVHCAPGCHGCCDMPVMASLPEALVVAEQLTEAEWDAVTRHARKVWDNAHDSGGERYAENHRQRVGFCPLLDRESGACRHYEVRPTRCRDTFSGLAARFCAPGAVARLSKEERRAYQREVHTNPVMDGHTHFIAPLEDLSVPATETFARSMRRAFGVEVWGDFTYLLVLTREDAFWKALGRRGERQVVAALKRARLYHPEIVQIG